MTVPILWLHGADAVGKTAVSWEIYCRLTDGGVAAAYVDTDHLGFCAPATREQTMALAAANLASTWPNFEAAGARCLVVAGIIVTAEHRASFEAAVPGGELTLCRLRAAPETIAERILRRGRIDGVGTDGAVSGLTLAGLAEQAEQAASFAALLDEGDLADFVVDTDGRSVVDVATLVLEQWTPAGPARFC